MKCTQFESATFKSAKKHAVFQHSGRMPPESSRRSFTREFKLKLVIATMIKGRISVKLLINLK